MIETSSADPIFLIILRTLIALGAALIGGIFAASAKKISHRVLCGLVSFAAGALLAVTIVNIIPESIEMIGVVYTILCTAAGTIIFMLIGKYVYYLCPACAASATENTGGYLRLGILMMVAMAIHSTVDGLAISAGSEASRASSASAVGIMILFAVSYHKIPEGMALVSVARLGGYSRAKALLTAFLIELTTAIGAFLGMFLLRDVSHMWLGIILGVIAGSFLYTVGFALLKEMYAHEKNSILIYILLGFILIVLTNIIISQTGLMVHSH